MIAAALCQRGGVAAYWEEITMSLRNILLAGAAVAALSTPALADDPAPPPPVAEVRVIGDSRQLELHL